MKDVGYKYTVDKRMKLNPAALQVLYAACKEFCRKCESGEARSVRSYKQMKAAIKVAEKES